MPDFAFVAADDRGKLSKSDNAVIRSHCMRGKNKREDSHRSRRKARRISKQIVDDSIPEDDSGDGDDAKGKLPTNGLSPGPAAELALLPGPASDLALVRWAGKTDHFSREIVYKFLAYSKCSNLLYPVERHLNFHQSENYLEWISRDVGFFHTVLLTTCAINDYVLKRPPGALTSRYLRDTLSHLNLKLSEKDGHNLDSVIFMVLTLGVVAAMFEDFGATGTHIQGLQQIVKLRGGNQYLCRYPKTYFKIERLELSWCLSTGRQPLFFPESVNWEPFFRGSLPLPDHLYGALSVDATWPRLTVVYNDLRFLADLMNEKDGRNERMNIEFFQDAVHSIQARLLDLQDCLANSIPECLRLGMLTFLATTFRLPGRKMPYMFLAQRLRDALPNLRPSTIGEEQAVFWILMMSVIAVIEIDERWIPDIWNAIVEEGTSWEQARSRLQSVMWIAFIHDELGQAAFLKLQQGRERVWSDQ